MTHAVLDFADLYRAHRQFTDPQADQHRRGQWIGRQCAAHAHPTVVLRRTGAGLGDQPQQGRVQRIDACGEPGVVAVHGQGVLRQVIGADGQEVRVFGQLLGQQRGSRHFNHHPQLRALRQTQFGAQGVEALADVQQFIDLSDHRQQDPAA
ncbi:hypothetical protein D3C78_1156650 [compost metagenome]